MLALVIVALPALVGSAGLPPVGERDPGDADDLSLAAAAPGVVAGAARLLGTPMTLLPPPPPDRPAARANPTTAAPRPAARASRSAPRPPPAAAPPTTQPAAPASQQHGQATWYATRDGTCAHPSLPMGTVVTVTNLASGLSVLCTVADRGPFGEGRIIDLDREVFAAIAPVGRGVVDVRIEW
ncbi:MAG: septal ring lytic transglycosylase RlpA family protein [Acidimicrobiales bacterium]